VTADRPLGPIGDGECQAADGDVDLAIEFGYDVLSNRIWKSVDPDGDGEDPATVLKFAYDPSGNAYVDFTGADTVAQRHVFGEGVDALIARVEAGDVTWYGQDLLGSTRDLFDSGGDLIDHLDYTPFGKLETETGSGSDRYLYTAREYDAELDLQYNRARYYDANTGRWISQDPLGFDAGDSNLYRYVSNRPAMLTDPIRRRSRSSSTMMAPCRAMPPRCSSHRCWKRTRRATGSS
jgi:RHS repeat-associated protein